MKWMSGLLLLIIGHLTLPAQQYELSGRVTDELGVPIEGVNIFIQKNFGTYTNQGGHFRIRYNKPRFFLTISHIGFNTEQVAIDFSERGTEKINDFRIEMRPDTFSIPQIEVTEQKIKTVFNDPIIEFRDFELSGENLLILARKGRHIFIRLQDEDQNILSEKYLDFKADALIKGCLGGYYAVDDTRAEEILVDGDNVEVLSKKMDRADFNRLVNPCVAGWGDTIVVRGESIHNKYVKYDGIIKGDSTPITIATIYDEVGAIRCEELYQEIIQLYHSSIGPGINLVAEGLWTGDVVDLAITYKLMQMVAMYKFTDSSPIAVPLRLIGDSLYLFDEVNNRFSIFSKDFIFIRSHPMSFHLTDKWKNELLVDETTNRVYAGFRQNGNVVLKEIDLRNGMVIQTHALTNDLMFPKKLRLKNGYLYFIGSDNARTHLRKIYKVNIFE